MHGCVDGVRVGNRDGVAEVNQDAIHGADAEVASNFDDAHTGWSVDVASPVLNGKNVGRTAENDF